MATPIQNSVVAITGASSGIGRAAALRFAGRGARLLLVARREQALGELAEECRRRGGEAMVAALDVADEAKVRAAAEQAVAAYGRIDAWINNAAVLMVGKFEDCPSEVYRRVIETNLFGYINGARAVLPLFKRQGRGTLVNVALVGGKIATPYQSAYNASKFAIVGWAESLRMELWLEKARHIHVCTVLPAFIDTPLFRQAANYTGRSLKPVRPVYAPEQVAEALLKLVRRPRRETVVGAAARFALVSHALAPALTERMVARAVERDHFGRGPAPIGEGNTLRPVDWYAMSTGGWRNPAEIPEEPDRSASPPPPGLFQGT